MFKVSAPGSMMLLGEHAVLHSQPAIVFAVNKRIEVELIPRDDNYICINSSLGSLKTDKNNLAVEKPFQFVLSAIKYFNNDISLGFDLNISSNIPDKFGLGSSAAITAATVAVLHKALLSKQPNNLEVFNIAKKIILEVQENKGSCSDLAASIFGGTVFYNVTPTLIEKLDFNASILSVYCGYKTPTVEVISKVKEYEQQDPELYKNIYKSMGDCTKFGLEAIKSNDYEKLGKALSSYQGLLRAINVSDNTIEDITTKLQSDSNFYGAKISGSGLGDCVIGLAKNKDFKINELKQYANFMVDIESRGLSFEV